MASLKPNRAQNLRAARSLFERGVNMARRIAGRRLAPAFTVDDDDDRDVGQRYRQTAPPADQAGALTDFRGAAESTAHSIKGGPPGLPGWKLV
jgi:hypothetical protein